MRDVLKPLDTHRLSIHFPTIADAHNKDMQSPVLNIGNYPVISYPIFPERAKP